MIAAFLIPQSYRHIHFRVSCSLVINYSACLPVRDAPFDIWGEGARVFVACKLFFLPLVENKFFFGDQRPTFFFYVMSKFFVVCFPYFVRYHLVFFSGQHIFHQFRQQTFFSAPIFNKLFFLLTFVATNYFFQF